MTWLRLQAAYFSNPTSLRAGWDGKVAFLGVMTLAKLHGMRKGVVPMADCEPEVLRAHLGCPQDRHSDEQLRHGIESCVRAGLLIPDGTDYHIKSWSKFQIDATAPERSKRYRDKKKRHSDDTSRNGNHGDIRTSRTSRTSRSGTSGPPGTTTPQPPTSGGNGSDPSPEPQKGLDWQTAWQACLAWSAREAEKSSDVTRWRAPAKTIRSMERAAKRGTPITEKGAWIFYGKVNAKDPSRLKRIVRSVIKENRNGDQP